MYEAEVEFSEGWVGGGGLWANPFHGGYGYFLGLHNPVFWWPINTLAYQKNDLLCICPGPKNPKSPPFLALLQSLSVLASSSRVVFPDTMSSRWAVKYVENMLCTSPQKVHKKEECVGCHRATLLKILFYSQTWQIVHHMLIWDSKPTQTYNYQNWWSWKFCSFSCLIFIDCHPMFTGCSIQCFLMQSWFLNRAVGKAAFGWG